MHRLWLLSLTLLIACNDNAATDAGSTETGDGVCYDIRDDVNSVQVINCGLPQPCAEAEFASSPSCEVTATYDPAVGACIVEQLAAGTQAMHSIRDCPGGQFSELWRLQVLGDGTVLYVDNQALDIGGNGRGTWRALPDAAYFQGCQTDTAEALIDCIDGIAEQDCQLGEPSCP